MSLSDDLKREHGEPEDVDPEEAFGGPSKGPYLPPGEYRVRILSDYTSYQETRSGGKMVKLDMEVQDEPQSGRRIFPNFNVINDNSEVAQEQKDRLQAVWEAAGGEPGTYPDTISDFHGREVIVQTGLEWDDYKDGDYQPCLWGVRPTSEGPPAGRRPDDEMPDVWEEALEYASDDDASSGAGGGESGRPTKTKSYDESDLDF